ncbi:hypothetical protein ACFSM5_17410 [Lacibacterium aquatile]|uniref:Uncharacterized protein n=1 Tax=Lacibacterium aquatile TaxID=1168082 RepID=A0ABW5DU73_9PROT
MPDFISFEVGFRLYAIASSIFFAARLAIRRSIAASNLSRPEVHVRTNAIIAGFNAPRPDSLDTMTLAFSTTRLPILSIAMNIVSARLKIPCRHKLRIIFRHNRRFGSGSSLRGGSFRSCCFFLFFDSSGLLGGFGNYD